jgi:hypothetical protein
LLLLVAIVFNQFWAGFFGYHNLLSIFISFPRRALWLMGSLKKSNDAEKSTINRDKDIHNKKL